MIIDKLSGSKVRFEVTVSKELFEHALDHAFEKVNKEVEIKGFRKGHAPRSVYEAKYGVESLYDEAINHALQDTYFEVVSENNIQVVAQPKINLEVEKIKRGQDFTYEVVVAVKPEIILGQYSGVAVSKPVLTVSEAEIDAEVSKELDKNAEMTLKEDGVIAQGDTAVFDFSGSVDGVKFDGGTAENHEMVIGSGQFIPGFEEQMIGLATDQTKNVVVTFPESYHEASLAGKEAIFEVLVHEIKTRVVPAIDDSFVKELNIEGVETVAQYREYLSNNLSASKQEKSKNDVTNQAIQVVVENASFDLPEEMIQEEASKMKEATQRQIKQYGLDFNTYLQYMGKTVEQYEEEVASEATRNLRAQLVIEAVGKKENLEVTNEEIETKYLEIVEQYKAQNVTIEQAKVAIPLDAVKDEVRFRKAVEFIVENVVYNE
ncbi:MAG: trigger factor [Candidatus Izemoplasmatales bacterium]|nr:trigger factor [bacterium]MDZ4196279.1 trigger factor [Candidatus Izemoplasmatales bacterium]